MTLVEFLAPLKNSTHKDRVLAVLYFQHHYNVIESLTIENIRQALKSARTKGLAKINIANVLARAGHFVDCHSVAENKRLWKLTPSGEKHVRGLLGLSEKEPEIEHDVGALTSTVVRIQDNEIRDYINEAIKCLQVGALRASIVFLWAGAIRKLQQALMAHDTQKVTTSIQKHDQRARLVNSIDDFAYIKDKVTLLAAQELGILDKNEKDTMEESLNLRNRCGHPSKYRPGVKKVSSFIEDVVSIIFA
jgi:hypothetical protein